MKILKYTIQGQMDVFDPETETVKQVPCIASVEGEEATEQNIARAKTLSADGMLDIVESDAFSHTVHSRLAAIEDVMQRVRRILGLS